MTFWNKVLESLKSPEARAYEEAARLEAERAQKQLEEEAARLEAEQAQKQLEEAKAAKKKAAAEKRKQTLAEKKKQPKSPKEIATKKGEPYVAVLSVDIDKKNPGNGNFELDWNDLFIKELRAAGYPGKTDEDVVDLWFRSVCRNVLAETYEQEVAQRPTTDNIRYINRKINDDGKTEVS